MPSMYDRARTPRRLQVLRSRGTTSFEAVTFHRGLVLIRGC